MKENRRKGIAVDRRKRNNNQPTTIIPPLPANLLHAREYMIFALMLSDIASLILAYGIAVWLRIRLVGDFTFPQFWNIFPILVFFLLVYAWNNLYPGVGLSPVHEMELIVNATTSVFLMLIALTFFQQTTVNYSRFILVIAWAFALVLVQVSRWLTRIIGRKQGFWGEPVAVVGTGHEGQQIVKFLNEHSRLGMRPVFTVDGFAEYEETPLVTINQSKIRTIILVITEMSAAMQKRIITEQRFGYYRRQGEKYIPKLIVISSLGWVGSMGITAIDLDGFLGLEVRQTLLNKGPNFLKRFIDLALTFFFGFLSAPFLILIMVLISLDSPGGIFYKQRRVGRAGKVFEMWKFRTMKKDADKVLQALLDSNPDLRAEWETTQKLKNDPRITRVGKFLRKFSLDEVPQLINVVKGEMSVVGPRPYFPEQQEIYGEGTRLYHRVRPGMTGMWQIRGRNTTSFKERARLDEYYIRNWSVWLDIYILVRTISVVVSRQGAY